MVTLLTVIFLLKVMGVKRMAFTNCTFISNIKKLCWLYCPVDPVEEKYQVTDCSFTINNTNLPPGDFAGVIRGAALKNCTFTFTDPDARKKGYMLAGYGEASNANLGGNEVKFRNR